MPYQLFGRRVEKPPAQFLLLTVMPLEVRARNALVLDGLGASGVHWLI